MNGGDSAKAADGGQSAVSRYAGRIDPVVELVAGEEQRVVRAKESNLSIGAGAKWAACKGRQRAIDCHGPSIRDGGGGKTRLAAV